MDYRVRRMLFWGVIILLDCIIIGVPVCALNIMVFEKTDRTVPIPQALIYANGEYTATTNENGTYNLSYEGDPPALRIAKAGYRDWIGTPSVNDTLLLVPLQIRNCTYSIHVFDADSLLPLSGLQVRASLGDGTMQQNPTDSNGSVTLPLKTEQVYDLTITGRNYQTIREKLVTGFENAAVQYSMIRNDRISLLVQDGNTHHPVSDVQITTDGKQLGVTNEKGILITNLTRGVDHMIEAMAPGYEKTLLQKNPGEEDLIIDLTLVPLKSTIFVSVYDPAKHPVEGAEVRINGNPVGFTTQYGRLSIPDLELRSYEFTVSKDEYKKESRTLDITPNSSDITFDLIPEMARVIVTVQDLQGKPLPNASVRVDGGSSNFLSKDNGTVNLDLKEGRSYLIAADLEGYLSNNTTVKPPVTTPVFLNLTPKGQKNDANPFPWLYLGIGGVLAMGAVLVLMYRGGGRKPSSFSRKKRMVLRKRSL